MLTGEQRRLFDTLSDDAAVDEIVVNESPMLSEEWLSSRLSMNGAKMESSSTPNKTGTSATPNDCQSSCDCCNTTLGNLTCMG